MLTNPAKNCPRPGGNVHDDITMAIIPGYIKQLTNPAKNCPRPGGNVHDDITMAIIPGYIKRLKIKQKFNSIEKHGNKIIYT